METERGSERGGEMPKIPSNISNFPPNKIPKNWITDETIPGGKVHPHFRDLKRKPGERDFGG